MRRRLRGEAQPRPGAVAGVVAGVALVASLLAACGGGGEDGTQQAVLVDAEYGVGTRTETFVDESRPTDGLGDQTAKPNRTLVTLTFYPVEARSDGRPTPDVPAAKAKGPFPLIVFSHGSGVFSPVRYELLFRFWVAAGYVVAAPKHPLSSIPSLEEGSADIVNQPQDMSFVISEMLRLNADPASPYGGLIDPARIAVGGHSLGAVTALGVSHNTCCVDARIKAGFLLSGGMRPYPGGEYFGGIRTPILVVHGDNDTILRLPAGQDVFNAAPAPKVMLTVIGGDHNIPFAGGPTQETDRNRGTPNEDTTVVIITTLGFLDRYVKNDSTALAQMRETLADEVIAKLEIVET